MTIHREEFYVQYAIGEDDAGKTEFPFLFQAKDGSHIVCWDMEPFGDDTTGKRTEIIDFSIIPATDGLDSGGGSVVLRQPVPVGHILRIERRTPLTQIKVFRNQAGIYPPELEDGLDRVVMMAQELARDNDLTQLYQLAEFVNESLAGLRAVDAELHRADAELDSKISGRATLIHAARHASDGPDPITPRDIGAADKDDPRFSDTRRPTAHRESHWIGGADHVEPLLSGAMPVAPNAGGPYAAVGGQWVEAPKGGDGGGSVGELPYMTDQIFGIGKVDGTSIISKSGVLSVPPPPEADTQTAGIVRVDGKTIESSGGVISAVPPPEATATTAGVVRIDGKTIRSNGGVVFVPDGSESAPGVVQPDGKTLRVTAGLLSAVPIPAATNDTPGLVKADGVSIRNIDGTLSVPRGDEYTWGIVRVDGTTITSDNGFLKAAQPPRGDFTQFGIVKVDGYTIISDNGILRATGRVAGGDGETPTDPNHFFAHSDDSYLSLVADVPDVYRENRHFYHDFDGYLLLAGSAEKDGMQDQFFIRDEFYIALPQARFGDTEPCFARDEDYIRLLGTADALSGSVLFVMDSDGYAMLIGAASDEAESDYWYAADGFAALRGAIA